MANHKISNLKLGIISGGQLAKLLIQAASSWNIQTFVLDTDENCPAGSICSKFIKGSATNYDDVYRFGQMVDLLTFELENINISALFDLQKAGLEINPDPKILQTIQDKGLQKQFLKSLNIQSPSFDLFENLTELKEKIASKEITLPFVQKLRQGGYDGRGVSVIKNTADLNQLMEGPSLVESWIDIDKEIAVIVARNQAGEIKCFPAVEMQFNQNANLVEYLFSPANIKEDTAKLAEKVAEKIASALNLVGILAIEMFIDKQEHIWVNEMAPRPHNSGHHTIENCLTSQYEQLLRAILNLPLGSTLERCPAVMLNLLGEPGHSGPARYLGLEESLAIEGVKVHLYGKPDTRPYRKMGHVTVISDTLEQALEKALKVKNILKVQT